MNRCVMILLLFVLCFGAMAVAQTDLTGKWQGKLAVGQDKISIEFIISKKPDGSFAATVNSPDNAAIKNVPAGAVTFKNSKLSFDVTPLSGSYSGTLDAKGVITGEWRQQGSVLPLVLTKYKAPEANALKPLLGEWYGKATIRPDVIYTLVFRFEIGKDGKLAGFLDSPDQGAGGIPMSDINLAGKEVTLKIPSAFAEFSGVLGATNLQGSVKQMGQEFKLDMVKGKYKAPEAQITISAESMKQLLGRWTGKLGQAPAQATAIFTFERDKAGKPAVKLEIVEQKLTVYATKATVTESDMSISVLGGEYVAKLAGNKIDGEVKFPGRAVPLSLVKEEK